MKIYYMGNFLPKHSTENHIAMTLRYMGHEVIELQEDFIQPDHLMERLKMENMDLFLFTRTWGNTLRNDHLDMLRHRGVPSASFHLDLYVGLQRDGNMANDPFWRTDYVFTPDGDPKSAQVFKEKGINHYYLKPGVFAYECDLFPANPDTDVIFVGSYSYHPEYPYRHELIDWLKNTYRERFEHWGSQGLGEVRGEDLNRLYGRTKVVVGDSLMLPGHTYYWSDRVYETLGRGGFLIHPFIEGMQEEFVDKKHLVFYKHGDYRQLKRLIDHYLIREEEREAVRLAGHQFVKEHATYTQRMEQMFATIWPNTNPKQNGESE